MYTVFLVAKENVEPDVNSLFAQTFATVGDAPSGLLSRCTDVQGRRRHLCVQLCVTTVCTWEGGLVTSPEPVLLVRAGQGENSWTLSLETASSRATPGRGGRGWVALNFVLFISKLHLLARRYLEVRAVNRRRG